MTVYNVTVTDLVTARPVTQVLVEGADLASAIEVIMGARALVGVHIVELAATVAPATAIPTWGPEWVESLRAWAQGFVVVHVVGSDEDPRGERAALERAAWLAATIDGKITEWPNGVTVERKDAVRGERPEAFLAFAPLPGQIN